MKIIALLFLFKFLFLQSTVYANTNDENDACAVILCLSSSKTPSECKPPLKRFFSISHKKWSDTLRGRRDFLKLCPTNNAEMDNYINTIPESAGFCSKDNLNNSKIDLCEEDNEGVTRCPKCYPNLVINNTMGKKCNAFYRFANFQDSLIKPVYIGSPHFGGFWASPDNLENARQIYNQKKQIVNICLN